MKEGGEERERDGRKEEEDIEKERVNEREKEGERVCLKRKEGESARGGRLLFLKSGTVWRMVESYPYYNLPPPSLTIPSLPLSPLLLSLVSLGLCCSF